MQQTQISPFSQVEGSRLPHSPGRALGGACRRPYLLVSTSISIGGCSQSKFIWAPCILLLEIVHTCDHLEDTHYMSSHRCPVDGLDTLINIKLSKKRSNFQISLLQTLLIAWNKCFHWYFIIQEMKSSNSKQL